MQTHLPEGVPLFRKKLEILVSKLQRWESVEFQVCPRVKKGSQVDKCVQTQPIVAIVGQVGHENTDLKNREGKKKHQERNMYFLYFTFSFFGLHVGKSKKGESTVLTVENKDHFSFLVLLASFIVQLTCVLWSFLN